ncbi:MAG: hypothetical protein AB1457_18245 [Chloroflexota bacterium]
MVNGKVLAVVAIATIIVVAIVVSTSLNQPTQEERITRQEAIPADAVKVTQETDAFRPVLHSEEWEEPMPVEGPINTAGAEDSAFIIPDGNTLYFFFTPDVDVPPEKQVLDKVTGIYVSRKQNGTWTEPERVILQDSGKLALDGAEFVQNDVMWFASAREGNFRGVDLWIAEFQNGKWANWQNAGETLNVDYGVGEMHITADGNEMYFHSNRTGGKGGLDIWVTRKANGAWQTPENVQAVNTAENEGWPLITQDGNELWFTRTYLGSPAVFRSVKTNGTWSEPQLIISQFAGEPSLDNEGNIYFTHHFFKEGKMIEADIYVAQKKH